MTRRDGEMQTVEEPRRAANNDDDNNMKHNNNNNDNNNNSSDDNSNNNNNKAETLKVARGTAWVSRLVVFPGTTAFFLPTVFNNDTNHDNSETTLC